MGEKGRPDDSLCDDVGHSDDEMINDDYHENTDNDTKLDKVLLARLVTTPALAKLC